MASKGQNIGAKNKMWKGDKVGYFALHDWIERVKGKAKKCEWCKTKTAKKYEWSNIDHKYRRREKDFISLCVTCHKRYDYKNFYEYKIYWVKCNTCEKIFSIKPHKIKQGEGKYCSKRCLWIGNKKVGAMLLKK